MIIASFLLLAMFFAIALSPLWLFLALLMVASRSDRQLARMGHPDYVKHPEYRKGR